MQNINVVMCRNKSLQQLLRFLPNFVCNYTFHLGFKLNPNKLTDGPKICLICIKELKIFSISVKNIVLKVTERNANFAHPENILLGTLADSDVSIRNAAVEKIVMISKIME